MTCRLTTEMETALLMVDITGHCSSPSEETITPCTPPPPLVIRDCTTMYGASWPKKQGLSVFPFSPDPFSLTILLKDTLVLTCAEPSDMLFSQKQKVVPYFSSGFCRLKGGFDAYGSHLRMTTPFHILPFSTLTSNHLSGMQKCLPALQHR